MKKLCHLSFFLLLCNVNSLLYSQPDLLDCKKIKDSLSVTSELDEDHWGWQQLPDLIGGMNDLYKRMKYPDEAIKNNIEGKVYISVVIDTLGLPFCPEILGKHLDYGCDDEAIRLVMESKFTPAIKENKYRMLSVTIPIKFSLINLKQ